LFLLKRHAFRQHVRVDIVPDERFASGGVPRFLLQSAYVPDSRRRVERPRPHTGKYRSHNRLLERAETVLRYFFKGSLGQVAHVFTGDEVPLKNAFNVVKHKLDIFIAVPCLVPIVLFAYREPGEKTRRGLA
jgi:hypothetical protein